MISRLTSTSLPTHDKCDTKRLPNCTPPSPPSPLSPNNGTWKVNQFLKRRLILDEIDITSSMPRRIQTTFQCSHHLCAFFRNHLFFHASIYFDLKASYSQVDEFLCFRGWMMCLPMLFNTHTSDSLLSVVFHFEKEKKLVDSSERKYYNFVQLNAHTFSISEILITTVGICTTLSSATFWWALFLFFLSLDRNHFSMWFPLERQALTKHTTLLALTTTQTKWHTSQGNYVKQNGEISIKFQSTW